MLLLAPGAGAPCRSSFMDSMAQGLAQRGLRVGRFDFPYMLSQRKRPPDKAPVLMATWRRAVMQAGPCFIGGKSMGGRIASMVADELKVAGLVCLGYPFHPPGKSEQLRVEHLQSLTTRALIVQGTRDPFGGPDEVAGYGLSSSIELAWVPEGDHSFKPPARSGHTLAGHLERACRRVATFCGV